MYGMYIIIQKYIKILTGETRETNFFKPQRSIFSFILIYLPWIQRKEDSKTRFIIA